MMLEGVIPLSPTSFVRVLSKPVASQNLATPPPCHRSKASVMTSLSWRNTQLMKKTFHCTPAVGVAHNVLLKKLGLSRDG
jgi:hypothetical protein